MTKQLRDHLDAPPEGGGHGLTGSARHLDDHELDHTHTADHNAERNGATGSVLSHTHDQTHQRS